jgi:Sec-independent protein translocase protein TatA
MLFVLIAIIVIPPEKLPEAMRTVGKVLRELRLASNSVVRELAEAIDEPYPPPARTPMIRSAIAAQPSAVAAPASPTASASTDCPADASAIPSDLEPQK